MRGNERPDVKATLHQDERTRRPAEPRPRILTETACQDIAQRLARCATGGGATAVLIGSTWRGTVRWARNLVSAAQDVRSTTIYVGRNIGGAASTEVVLNDTSDTALVAAVRRAERLASFATEERYADLFLDIYQEPMTTPSLFSEATYQLDPGQRAAAARKAAQPAAAAGMLAAGYIEVSAHTFAYITTWGQTRFCQWTEAQYSVTVRDPKGKGSGWAGVDWPDWRKIDVDQLSALALEKCLTSRNPVAIEPGRYTTILEPQAVGDFTRFLLDMLQRSDNEEKKLAPFYKKEGFSQLGERVMDKRITITSDPMDPRAGFPPWGLAPERNWDLFSQSFPSVSHAATWIDHGVLTNLGYNLFYAEDNLGRGQGLPVYGAFQMTGGDTSMAEMIATTKRGLLVTRFDDLLPLNNRSLFYRGYTRDGLWLIENGKISRAVKNLAFTESILFPLNNIEQLGVPQRIFHPTPGAFGLEQPRPIVVPPLKVSDFSFTALVDAV